MRKSYSNVIPQITSFISNYHSICSVTVFTVIIPVFIMRFIYQLSNVFTCIPQNAQTNYHKSLQSFFFTFQSQLIIAVIIKRLIIKFQINDEKITGMHPDYHKITSNYHFSAPSLCMCLLAQL